MSAKIRVLVIDDEAAILRFLKPALEANNYEMTSAGTIAEGIKRIAAETPDVVLLDLGLPDGDGKDIIRRAREWSDLPIIVLSARERETEKIESLDLGADDYVNKPFNVGELLARMRAALRHRMQRKSEIPVLRVGNLDARRDVTDVRDIVRGYEVLVARGRQRVPYNLCSGQAYRVGDLLDLLLEMSRVAVRVEQDPSRLRPSHTARRSIRPDRFLPHAGGWPHRRHG